MEPLKRQEPIWAVQFSTLGLATGLLQALSLQVPTVEESLQHPKPSILVTVLQALWVKLVYEEQEACWSTH